MIKIIHVSDLHFGRREDGATKRGTKLLKDVATKFSFSTASDTYLLYTGDFVNGEEPARLAEEWDDSTKILKSLFSGKLLCCPGNHDQSSVSGGLGRYHEFCKHLSVDNGDHVFRKFESGDTKLSTLGLNSTWEAPGLGIAGLGKLTDTRLTHTKNFANENYDGWKLCYLHHRPVEGDDAPSCMGCKNADKFLDEVSEKVDILAFGHDKSFSTDYDKHSSPSWLNANREPGYNRGWLELVFERDQCTVTVFDLAGQSSPSTTIARK
jgi:hypothetical protein